MQFNVAQLLKSAPGTERRYTLAERDRRFEELPAEVRGPVRLMRTDRGVLVMAAIDTGVNCTCSRCLADFVAELHFDMADEYFPTVDIVSGERLEAPSDDCFTIDAHHILDLGEAVRQYAVMHSPMKPLCRDDCAGLCPTCGADLNQGRCACPRAVLDSRWAKLAGLRSRVREAV